MKLQWEVNKMKKALQIILHIVGFPLLIALVIVFSINMFKLNISYGVMAFVGLIITVVMAIIYYLVFFLMKKSGKKSIYKQTIVSIIVASICLGGFWILIDVAIPDLLADATSDTIYYEDLADDYDARAEINKGLLDEFIKLNYENGNLKAKKLKDYLNEGYSNKEVQKLIKTNFQSIDKDGYATFVGPWIDFANDDRMTIPTLVHLLLNERDLEGVPFLVRVDGEMKEIKATWTVLDMAGDEMVFDLGEDGMGVVEINLSYILDGIGKKTVERVFEALTASVSADEVATAPIYFELVDGSVLRIIPSNVERGVLDYKRMAWLDSNSLIIMITALFSIRKLFLIFAGVLIITTYAIGLLRENEAKNQPEDTAPRPTKSKKVKATKDSVKTKPATDNVVEDCYDNNEKTIYIVVKRGERLNIKDMTRQLIYDAQNGIVKRYESAVFLKN